MNFSQEPSAGRHLVMFAGDILELRASCDESVQGRAFVRTNWNSARIRRAEIVANVEDGKGIQERNWQDLPMTQEQDGSFRAFFPLAEVGVFEFKSCFVAQDGRRIWCEGNNLSVKVDPACTVACNSIYNAFIRQFGENCSADRRDATLHDAEKMLDERGYTVIPPSGKFAEFKEKLPFIMDKMGFRIIMFLPIHPTPTSFARMGRFGSPFAPLDFYTVDPAMATFDQKTTPLEQFVELLDIIHFRNGLAMIDLPLDHTGWASALQTEHPEWFRRNEDGSFESPGAWGVTWADLCKLDFNNRKLWKELANIVLHWCRLGVDGFRCDAGYMLPTELWEYVTEKVRQQYPDTIFLLEGLGGPIEKTEELMCRGGMNWAYSESFQQYGAYNESRYLEKAIDCSEKSGVLVNFAETHDNNRLAAESKAWSRRRVATAALTAPNGAFGMANGVEWFAKDKIDVHGDSSLNWGAADNQIDFISRLNYILKWHPAFVHSAPMRILQSARGNDVITLLRGTNEDSVLVLINTNIEQPSIVIWKRGEWDCGERAWDLLSCVRVGIEAEGDIRRFVLPPGYAVVLSGKESFCDTDFVALQETRAALLNFLQKTKKYDLLKKVSIIEQALELSKSPERFIEHYLNMQYTEWLPQRDCRRIVMLPRNNVLLIKSKSAFSITMRSVDGEVLEFMRSLKDSDGGYFVILAQNSESAHSKLTIEARLCNADGVATLCKGTLRILDFAEEPKIRLELNSHEITELDNGMCTNVFGSYTMSRAFWGELQSKYDALMALNMYTECPNERIVCLTRCRAWLRYKDYSRELGRNCQISFKADYNNNLQWEFNVQCGIGFNFDVRAIWHLERQSNAGNLSFYVLAHDGVSPLDEEPVIILRPDVDFRSNHSATKAYSGPEGKYHEYVIPLEDGFAFAPDECNVFSMHCKKGNFAKVPEWKYMVPLEIEKQRGLEDSMDTFSPGYFILPVNGKEPIVLWAGTGREISCSMEGMETEVKGEYLFEESLKNSLDYFVVKRDEHKSVIAGYPWFLDWGRDTLICLRGLIAAGMKDVAKDIISQFAMFIENGTLPNMIRGKDTSDRDTSDAPLWLFVAVDEYIRRFGDNILMHKCGKRLLKAALEDLAEALWNGARNGVRADKESGLLFSRPHFTWMDTNYPAGTPRSGYPVEIEALWIYAMEFVANCKNDEEWRKRANLARNSLLSLFVRADGKGLSDCLHCDVFAPAKVAIPDDACRPNQLLAVTLGIVKDSELMKNIVKACSQLLIPGGIRSLADEAVNYPIPIIDNGKSLNDPYRPYWGVYGGNEDTRRKPAYHNGTCWAWQMPLFSEAEYMAFGAEVKATARDRLYASIDVLQHGCLGFLPEIYDGDAPHVERGCPAQAWSMTEFYRVLILLNTESVNK